jgi:hypothetical protein
MAELEYPRLEACPAVELAVRLKLRPAAQVLAPESGSVANYVRRLVDAAMMPAALTVLAHALPRRQAVWWAGLAARHTRALFPAEDGGAAMDGAIKAVERWVRQPAELNRRLAEDAAKAAGLDNPAGLAAQAAFWSGGSLAPDDVPMVPPDPTLTGNAVAGAVKLAVFRSGPVASEARGRAFMAMAFDIAAGGDGRGVPYGDAA